MRARLLAAALLEERLDLAAQLVERAALRAILVLLVELRDLGLGDGRQALGAVLLDERVDGSGPRPSPRSQSAISPTSCSIMLRRFWYIAWMTRARSAASNCSHLASTSFSVIGLPATSATT